jgi:2,3-dihydroxybenzoate decarboxylase
MASRKGTVAIEEAVLNPEGIAFHAQSAIFFSPASTQEDIREHGLTKALLDIHTDRLARMDATGVEYMLLSLTSAGPQGEPDPAKAATMASRANDWLAGQVAQNPSRFGALASLAMHDTEVAVAELRRAVRELGMFGAIINDFQDVYEDDGRETVGKAYYDDPKYHPFWAAVQELDVPVYLHPRYPAASDVGINARYGQSKRQLIGAGVQFHLDLSYHVYALCSSGIFDLYPKVQLVIGHLGEG